MNDCFDCGYLDKRRKETCDAGAFRYGCNDIADGFICGWVGKDSELRYLGCSRGIEKKKDEQITFAGLIK